MNLIDYATYFNQLIVLEGDGQGRILEFFERGGGLKSQKWKMCTKLLQIDFS